jgi:hypothetical protein
LPAGVHGPKRAAYATFESLEEDDTILMCDKRVTFLASFNRLLNLQLAGDRDKICQNVESIEANMKRCARSAQDHFSFMALKVCHLTLYLL